MIKNFLVKNSYAADVAGGSIDTSKWLFGNFSGIVEQIIVLFIVFAGIIFTVMLIYGGVRYITSSGDVKQMDSARKIVTAAVIGILIVVASYAIGVLLKEVFGVPTFGDKLTSRFSGNSGAGEDPGQFDYSNCAYGSPLDYETGPNCASPHVACCYGHGCIDIQVVLGGCGGGCASDVCELNSSSCFVDWRAWESWINQDTSPTGPNHKYADEMCIKCNVCRK